MIVGSRFCFPPFVSRSTMISVISWVSCLVVLSWVSCPQLNGWQSKILHYILPRIEVLIVTHLHTWKECLGFPTFKLFPESKVYYLGYVVDRLLTYPSFLMFTFQFGLNVGIDFHNYATNPKSLALIVPNKNSTNINVSRWISYWENKKYLVDGMNQN